MAALGDSLSPNRRLNDPPMAFVPVDNGGKIGKVSPRRRSGWKKVAGGHTALEAPRNAFSPCFEGACALYSARSDPGAVGADLRARACRLGRQRHQDREPARAGRADGRPARGRRFSEPAPQQAQHDAQPESARRARRVQAHGQKGRRGGGEFPPRREEAAQDRLQDARQDQSAPRLCQHFRLRPGRTLCRPARLRSDRARHGRTDVDHRPAGPGAGAGRHPDR